MLFDHLLCVAKFITRSGNARKQLNFNKTNFLAQRLTEKLTQQQYNNCLFPLNFHLIDYTDFLERKNKEKDKKKSKLLKPARRLVAYASPGISSNLATVQIRGESEKLFSHSVALFEFH